MKSEFNSRAEAVAWLKKEGLDAFERDWVMGETIGVAAGKLPENENGIEGWKHMVYIHIESGEWAVSDLKYQDSKPIVCGSLESAAIKAKEMLEEKLSNEKA